MRPTIVVGLLLGGLLPSFGAVPATILFAVPAAACIILDFIRNTGSTRLYLAGVAIFFALMASHALFVTPEQNYGLDKLTSLLTLTLLTTLSASIVSGESRVTRLAMVWTVVAAGLGLLAALEVLVLGGDDLTGRAEGFAESPIWLARAIMTGAVLCFWLMVKGVIPPPLAIAIIVVDFVGILSTGSRGPLLGAVVGVAIIAIFGIKWTRRRLAVATVGLSALTGILVTLAAILDSRILRLGLGGESDAQRQEYWSLSLQSIAREPFGVGFGHWADATSPTLGLPRYPHNLFLESGSELGWFWLIALLGITALAAVTGIKNVRTSPHALALLGVFVAETIQVSISGDLNARTFFFFAGAMLLVGYRHRTQLTSGDPAHGRGEAANTGSAG